MHMCAIPAVGRLKQGDPYEFEASLGLYSECKAILNYTGELVSKTKAKQKRLPLPEITHISKL